MSCAEGAEHYQVSHYSALRWTKRQAQAGSRAALPMSGKKPFALADEEAWVGEPRREASPAANCGSAWPPPQHARTSHCSRDCVPRILYLAPTCGCSVCHPTEGFGFTQQRHSHIDACNNCVAVFELRRHPIRFSIVWVVEPAVFPGIWASELKVPQDCQATEESVA